MTTPRPDAPDPRERSNLIAGAVVLVLLFAGVVVAVVAMSGGFGRRDGTARSGRCTCRECRRSPGRPR